MFSVVVAPAHYRGTPLTFLLTSLLLGGLFIGVLFSAVFAWSYLRSKQPVLVKRGKWLAGVTLVGIGVLRYLVLHL
jgi:hypothetical protein